MTGSERREQLLEVTTRIAAEQGFPAVSIESVARRAGISRPIVYEHFGDLPGLLEAVVERETSRALSQVSETALTDLTEGDPQELMLESLGAYLHAVRDHPTTWRLVLIPPEGAPAGNRVVIKPSEYTPACAELLRQMIRATFDGDRVDVVVGGVELARAFAQVRWDHLLYTGNAAIGREIAKAAAEQLVPVTLELGGKCPAILAADSIDAESVKQVLGTKAIKNGQMCISVDYCLVPREQLSEFAALAADHPRTAMPGYGTSESCTGIITTRHLERIERLLEEARARGCEILTPEGSADGETDPATRQLPISLVVDPPEDLALMREEIFGPILPISPYDSLDEAVGRVNAGERPLALYVFAKDEAIADDVLRRTSSGGACVNTAAAHGALPSLPFGGIGQSGSGRHHGIEGFREFSNLRAVYVRGEGDLTDAFAPPYGPAAQALVDAAFGGAG